MPVQDCSAKIKVSWAGCLAGKMADVLEHVFNNSELK